jgi:hypothetical protein
MAVTQNVRQLVTVFLFKSAKTVVDLNIIKRIRLRKEIIVMKVMMPYSRLNVQEKLRKTDNSMVQYSIS